MGNPPSPFSSETKGFCDVPVQGQPNGDLIIVLIGDSGVALCCLCVCKDASHYSAAERGGLAPSVGSVKARLPY